MATGRKKLAPDLKVVKGTFRKDRERAVAKAANPRPAQMRPSTSVNAAVRKNFSYLAGILKSLGIASLAYCPLLTEAAKLMRQIEVAEQELEDAKGATYEITGENGTRIVEHPAQKRLERNRAMFIKTLTELGLTPSAIQRVTSMSGEKPVSGFEEFVA